MAVEHSSHTDRRDSPAAVTTDQHWPLGRRLLIVAGCFLTAAFGIVWITSANRGLPFRGGLAIEETHLDFGEVWMTNTFRWTIPIQNTSGSPIVLTSVITPCNCTTALDDLSGKTIPPQGVLELPLLVDLTRAPGVTTVGNQKLVDLEVNLYPQDPAPALTFHLRGTVSRTFEFEPAVLDYEESLSQGTRYFPRYVAIKPLVPVKRILASTDPALGQAEVTRGDDGYFRLQFTPSPNLPMGPFEGLVLVTGVLDNDGSLPPVVVPVKGIVRSHIHVLPQVLDLGICRLGEAATGALCLESASGEPFVIVDICPDHEYDGNQGELKLNWKEDVGAKRQVVEVSVNPRRPGHFRATIKTWCIDHTNTVRTGSAVVMGYVLPRR